MCLHQQTCVPSLGNNTLQHVMQQWKNWWNRCFLCGPSWGYITRTNGTRPFLLSPDSVSTESWDSKIWPRVLRSLEPRITGVMRTSSNLPNLTEPISCSPQTVASQPPSTKDMCKEAEECPLLWAHYLAMPDEDREAWMYELMVSRVCRSIKTLQLPVAASHTCSIDATTNPNTVYNH
jgi:hypothetical protein